ncbi:hypothetical protein L798_09510 [Zootermopsis nevadensis]|uniref:Uncharacterized protein n=1 Tax=Zootermopsis nevadensis TaxID=136037 RepID=A0A067RAS3_ZOONE|nr:hypothetical protein L798_09510 [Zootermopsis nevadensis]
MVREFAEDGNTTTVVSAHTGKRKLKCTRLRSLRGKNNTRDSADRRQMERHDQQHMRRAKD